MRLSRSGTDPLDPGPEGFAHRGLHYGSGLPENSLIAFAAALEAGAGIECDLRLTTDGRIVIFHDADAWRMCSSPIVIGTSTHAELKNLRVGDGPIPTLENLLQLVGSRVPLLLEVKVEGDIWRWMPALKTALRGYRGPFGIMSFDPRVARLLRTNMPQVRRGLVVRERLPAWKRQVALWLADPHFIAVERTAVNTDWVARMREHIPVYSWTIKSREHRAQAEVHADALIWESDGRP